MSARRVSGRYPRRRPQRSTLRLLGRALLPLLTRTEISGQENYPLGGPLLVVGNHIAAMEVVLMVAYAPWQVEMLGPGDIPPPPAMDAIARLYGYTPINRGNADREALAVMLDVLRQRGIVGIFPEGGIWDPGIKPAKRGVAWLSYQAQAPVLPIGFAGLEGALNAALRLERPRLAMNVGRTLPPVTLTQGESRKACLRAAAARVMQVVHDLIPEWGRAQTREILDERFDLLAAVQCPDGTHLPSGELKIVHASALSKMFYRPAILRVFGHDLHLPVEPLQRLEAERDPLQIARALQAILDYIDRTNPGFFTYRFGSTEGKEMEIGLRELHALARHAAESNCALAVTPLRRYHLPGSREEIVESSPGQSHRW